MPSTSNVFALTRPTVSRTGSPASVRFWEVLAQKATSVIVAGELAVIEHLLARHPGLVEAHPLAPHHHTLLGSVVRERGQQNRLDDAEDRGRRADPQ